MPADVAVHANFLTASRPHHHHHHHPHQRPKSPSCGETWPTPEPASGKMKLVNADGHTRQAVQVTVYRTSVEHFAVIYSIPECAQPSAAGNGNKQTSGNSNRPLGVLNLRNATIERSGDDGFVVRQKGLDTPVALHFILESDDSSPKTSSEIDHWILAFTPRTSPLVHHSCLPIVQEEEI